MCGNRLRSRWLGRCSTCIATAFGPVLSVNFRKIIDKAGSQAYAGSPIAVGRPAFRLLYVVAGSKCPRPAVATLTQSVDDPADSHALRERGRRTLQTGDGITCAHRTRILVGQVTNLSYVGCGLAALGTGRSQQSARSAHFVQDGRLDCCQIATHVL